MFTENRAKDPMEKTIIGNWKIMIMIQLFKKFRAKREHFYIIKYFIVALN